MTGRQRLVVAALAAVATLVPAQPALAHGGGDATSNYRTRVLDVQPEVADLTVQMDSVRGTVRLTYAGPGTLVVIGYDDEPYLRVGPQGVEQNRHSPATYLNQDRYARVALPSEADADAEPQWDAVSDGRTVEFHDHRTHWMSTVPPAQVQADPDEVTVIFDRWQIPMTLDGQPITIAGDLTWVPPPSRLPWVAVGVVVAALTAVAMSRRRWLRTGLAVAAIGTIVFCIDTVGYWRASDAAGAQLLWLLGWPLVAIGATTAVAVGLRRQPDVASGWMALAALVVAAVGGWDRIDVITHSQIQSAHPDWLTRASAVVCLALGGTLLVRFLADLVPRALGTGSPRGRPSARTE